MLSTPYGWIDLDIMEKNIREMQQRISANGQVLRPHIKTHRSLEIAKMQLAAGAVGITCSKLAEAMVMARGGIKDIFLAYGLVGEDKMQRLKELMELAKVTVTCDNPLAAEQLDRVGQELGRPVPVLVEVLTHIQRGGVAKEQLVEFVRLLQRLPGVEFAGLFAYSGLSPDLGTLEKIGDFARGENDLLEENRRLLEDAGIPVPYMSGGSTVISRRADQMERVNESRAGNYVFYDMHYVQEGAARLEQCALKVKATVISTPVPGRATLDCGSKILSSDHKDQGFGRIEQYPEAVIFKLNEEHGFVQYDPQRYSLRVGEQVDVIPHHSCVVANLVDTLFGFRGGVFDHEIRVDARGKSY